MERSNKDAWLTGPADLKEAVVEDVPVPGQNVLVRGLAAAFSREAASEAMEYRDLGSAQQTGHVNTAKMDVLRFAHGVIEPKFTVKEAEAIMERFGPACEKVIAKIDELSGLDVEAVTEAQARFPAGGTGENGSAVEAGTPDGSGGSDLPPRTGAGVEDAGG